MKSSTILSLRETGDTYITRVTHTQRLQHGVQPLQAASRAGGTFSGPVLMALIDVCMYAAVLGASGDDPRALTSNVAITFLRRAPARDALWGKADIAWTWRDVRL
jgi:acyl-coenzyme A thioesterase PaaI-like protein